MITTIHRCQVLVPVALSTELVKEDSSKTPYYVGPFTKRLNDTVIAHVKKFCGHNISTSAQRVTVDFSSESAARLFESELLDSLRNISSDVEAVDRVRKLQEQGLL